MISTCFHEDLNVSVIFKKSLTYATRNVETVLDSVVQVMEFIRLEKHIFWKCFKMMQVM